jgi:hypothetical protein
MDICDAIPEEVREEKRGREAAYLACIAARRLAINRSDLGRARSFLREAIGRDDHPGAEDLRFTSEQLSINERTYLLERLVDRLPLRADAVARTLKGLVRLHGLAPQASTPEIQAWLENQALTHFFTLVLLVMEAHGGEDDDLRRASLARILRSNLREIPRLLTAFDSLLAQDASQDFRREDDPFGYLIRDVATAVWCADRDAKEAADRSARLHVMAWRQISTPYDEDRLHLLGRSVGLNPKEMESLTSVRPRPVKD